MSPRLLVTLDAARELAWWPHTNFGGHRAHLYQERRDAHQRLVDRLADLRGLSANAGPELRALIAAVRRVAACTFSNRTGLPYAERRQAMAQLRGAFDAWDRARGAEPVEWPRPGAQRGRHAARAA